MSILSAVILRGTRASQPLATAVSAGTLYFVTDELITERSSGSAWQSYSGASGGLDKIKQIVKTQTGAVATGSTIIPADDTIPQNSEGNEYMTLAITPTSATSRLRIDVTIYMSSTGTPLLIGALFQDSTANALAAAAQFNPLATASLTLNFTHDMVAGTTSSTTFKVRAGPSSAATLTFNGQAAGRFFGGVAASSIVITEYTP